VTTLAFGEKVGGITTLRSIKMPQQNSGKSERQDKITCKTLKNKIIRLIKNEIK
jgi:hypothetical protein